MREKKDKQRNIFLLLLLVLGLVTALNESPVQGQEVKFPSKSVEVVVPFTPGGFADVATRIFTDYLSRELKVSVIIRNIGGGGGIVGATAFMNTRPDGYTILSWGSTMIPAVLSSKIPPFDPRKELLPVGLVASAPIALAVHKNSPFNSFSDLLQFAKSNPDKLVAGIPTTGTEVDLAYIFLIRDSNIKVKMVPHTGTGQLNAALLGKHLDFLVGSLPGTAPIARSGDVRILVLTSKSPEFPDVPAGPDIGLPGFSLNIWQGFFVHPQAPKYAYDRLVSAVESVSKNPEVAKKLANAGYKGEYKNPREISKMFEELWEAFSQMIKETGKKVD